jgi:hypothetical protein
MWNIPSEMRMIPSPALRATSPPRGEAEQRHPFRLPIRLSDVAPASPPRGEVVRRTGEGENP